ncbi:M15 family metallopeptidase [Tenacibaculum insulae]|uniref:M15 family metallopeptidase n=1 Tax=Tenacibaculum insulae TaxID=2029677 RepID=UPI003AB74F17
MKKILILIILIYSCKKDKQDTKNTNIINDVCVSTNLKEKIEYTYDNNFVLGKFDYKKDTTFSKVDKIHSSKTLYINKEVYSSFIKMFNHAKKENIDLKIISGTRNFYEQKSIWERKWLKYQNLKPINRALKILEYSSMPSTSRHHWGTDIDLNNLNNSYFETGKGKKEYQWLVKNAKTYGFTQVYTSKKNGRKGYNMEKWHWSYIPLSEKYLNFYNNKIKLRDISDFKGAKLAIELNVIQIYVNGINKEMIIE